MDVPITWTLQSLQGECSGSSYAESLKMMLKKKFFLEKNHFYFYQFKVGPFKILKFVIYF